MRTHPQTVPISPLARYLRDLAHVHNTGGGTDETSYYEALGRLLNDAGRGLKPAVKAVFQLTDTGYGRPDVGLFTSYQFDRDNELKGTDPRPERGVGEVKGAGADLRRLIESAQVKKYLDGYGLVLVTNLRQFAVVVPGPFEDAPVVADEFSLGDSEGGFWATAAHPDKVGPEVEAEIVAFLERALQYAVPVDKPQDLARALASYARQARARLDRLAKEPGGLDALAGLRSALETTLGASFQTAKGERFFRATVIQTLFYGVFSAWTLWHREQLENEARGWKDEHGHPTGETEFRWRYSVDYLRVPVIAELFHQLTGPKVQKLGLTDLLDRTERLLARVRRDRFFALFRDAEAIQYFYEPFLEAYDPDLRKQLGVWYTPPEIVRYMVARVDRVLKDELGEPDGLASENVVVLDPCCGTGAYLVEVLRHIRRALVDSGAGATVGTKLRRAATERLFGFELLTAPFVVAHLQMGLALRDAGAPLGDGQRAAVYLTNALTGWTPTKDEGQRRLSDEFEQEVEAARHVKRDERILVVLGNPPYDGYSGLALEEERNLTDAYRASVSPGVPRPSGQGLNDLYVRFFRIAERQIAEKTGRGVVCYVSNNSWLGGLSHPAMRERFLTAFDRVWIDNLHGNRIAAERTPDGKTSETVFAVRGQSPGIKVGVCISTFARKDNRVEDARAEALYRDFWQADPEERRAVLDALAQEGTLAGLGAEAPDYEPLQPEPSLGLALLPHVVAPDFFDWPTVPDLFPVSFPGIKTARDEALVDIDRDRLDSRIRRYFDPDVNDTEVAEAEPVLMRSNKRFDAPSVRRVLQRIGHDAGRIVPYLYRPFDVRSLFWVGETKLLDEKRADYVPHVFEGNLWIAASQGYRRSFDPPIVTKEAGGYHVIEHATLYFPLHLAPDVTSGGAVRENLSDRARRYLEDHGATADDLFHHALAVMHAPAYRAENAGALKQDWPRIPLPDSADALRQSAALGRTVAALLDPSAPVPGVTAGSVRPELRRVAVPERADGGQLDEAAGHTAVTVRWGYLRNGKVSGSKGHAVERPAPESQPEALGAGVIDVYLNDGTRWGGVPSAVWAFTLGGYPVLKKWLSYRPLDVLGRPLTIEDVEHFQNTARRIAALLLLVDDLDAAYAASRSAATADGAA